MPGAEYLTADVCFRCGRKLAGFRRQLAEAKTVRASSSSQPGWNVVGRVHFNLAENRKDEQAPFAFLATYTHRLSGHGKAQHLPLGQALREYAGAASKEKLLSLLLPVQRAAERCAWLRQMVDAGEIYHPLRWSPREAFRLLGDIAELEHAGIVVRMPVAWRAGRPPRPQVTATVGAGAPSALGTDALLDFRMEVTLDGQKLTRSEVKEILAGANGLAFIRGQWVEVDRERLERMMDRFKEAERLATTDGLSFAEAMRMLAGACRQRPSYGQIRTGPVAWPLLTETFRGCLPTDCEDRPGPDLHYSASLPGRNDGCTCQRFWFGAPPTTWVSARPSVLRSCSCFAGAQATRGRAFSWPRRRCWPTGSPRSSVSRRASG
jgi:hypothetical protein